MYNRIFTFEDQIAFADLSGDVNPLHIDPIIARRYMFGQPIIHGVHSVLWGLDTWLEGRIAPLNLRSLKALFLRPMLLEEQLQYSSTSEGPHDAAAPWAKPRRPPAATASYYTASFWSLLAAC